MSPGSPQGPLTLFPFGPHRVESWKLKAGCRPLKEKLFWSGKGQANIKGELGRESRGEVGAEVQ